MLGAAQWAWLEHELRDEKPRVFFITSGIQVIPDDRLQEHWSYRSRQRLYNLIGSLQRRVVLLSGDVHFAEFLQDECSRNQLGYPLSEFTSSGLNLVDIHWQPLSFFSNNIKAMMEVGLTNTYSTPNDRFIPVPGQNGLNYGRIDITEDAKDPENSEIVLNVMPLGSDAPVLFRRLKLRDLKPNFARKIDECEFHRLSAQFRWLQHFFQGVLDLNPQSWKVFVFFLTIFLVIPGLALFVLYWLLKKLLRALFAKGDNAKTSKTD